VIKRPIPDTVMRNVALMPHMVGYYKAFRRFPAAGSPIRGLRCFWVQPVRRITIDSSLASA
jgi:hypothetical protein